MKQLLPAPLIGFIVAIIFLVTGIQLPNFIDQAFTYIGNIVTPLALIYIGIMLSNSKLSSIRFDRDTSVALLGRFVISPISIICLLMLGGYLGHNLSIGLKETLIIQSATPALAILPVLAVSSHGDTKYATNVVTTSTLVFIVVVPIIMFFYAIYRIIILLENELYVITITLVLLCSLLKRTYEMRILTHSY